jgi:threonylcarbamoyladenosine tRNA methylthiotransferase CDKAL1
MGKKIYVENAGCNRRQLELRRIRQYLVANGYHLVDSPQHADCILLSTCAFKEQEEERSVARLRALRRYRAEILVYGCLPDIAPEKYLEFRDIPKIAPKELHTIDTFFPDVEIPFAEVADANQLSASEGGNLRTALRRLLSGEFLTPSFYSLALLAAGRKLGSLFSRWHPDYYLFVCRGCLGKCAYCAIRRAVGPVRSKPVETVLAEFRQGVERGYRDFSILGDDPGCYGLDIGSSLPELLRSLQAERRALAHRVRKDGDESAQIGFHIKEIHPKFLIRYADDLAELCREGPIKSLLCPLQSGNDRVLKLMAREHTLADFQQVLERFRRAGPHLDLTTQIIIGFPTETEEEFLDTLRAVRDIRFDSVVVFPYHDKEGTLSSRLEGKISQEIIRRRMRQAFRYFRREGIKAYYNVPLQ